MTNSLFIMQKILCLIDSLGLGGAERQMIGLASFLQQKGYRVDLVTYYNCNFYFELGKQYGLQSKTLRVNNHYWSKLIAVRKQIKDAGGYDWVIAYKDGPSIISCLLKLFGEKYKLIVSERNTNQTISYKNKIKFFFYRFADYIVPNAYTQEKFIKLNFPKLSKRTITISNFTDTDFFVPGKHVLKDRLTIMTAARVAKQKNIINYLYAIKILKDKGINVKFDWFGDVQKGEEAYGEKVLFTLTELNLEDMITFHPATTDVLRYYQSCDIFCLPSIYEGFPNAICEAMSCGKPIICSRVCDNPFIVKENGNGLLFNPNDVDDMALQLEKICTMSANDLTIWGKNSRKIGEKLFSKDAFVAKYISLLEC